jgi:hypothetical protein
MLIIYALLHMFPTAVGSFQPSAMGTVAYKIGFLPLQLKKLIFGLKPISHLTVRLSTFKRPYMTLERSLIAETVLIPHLKADYGFLLQGNHLLVSEMITKPLSLADYFRRRDSCCGSLIYTHQLK